MLLEKLFAQFIREKTYLDYLSPQTIKYPGWIYNRCKDLIDEFTDKLNTKEFGIKLNESELSPFTINSYARGFNSFLSWLYENEHTSEHLKIKKIKTGTRGIKTYSESELKKILSFRPKTFIDKRLYGFICLMIDCGLRIQECRKWIYEIKTGRKPFPYSLSRNHRA